MSDTRSSERWFRRHDTGLTARITEAFFGVFFVDVQDTGGRSVLGRTQVCAQDGRIEAERVLRRDFDHRCTERCGDWVCVGTGATSGSHDATRPDTAAIGQQPA